MSELPTTIMSWTYNRSIMEQIQMDQLNKGQVFLPYHQSKITIAPPINDLPINTSHSQHMTSQCNHTHPRPWVPNLYSLILRTCSKVTITRTPTQALYFSPAVSMNVY